LKAGIGNRLALLALVPVLTLCAVDTPPGQAASPARTTVEADLVGAWNPNGLLAVVGGSRRWSLAGDPDSPLSPYLQAGFSLGSSPAYARGSVYAEWMPHVAVQLRAQYNLYRYYGGNSVALLSFPSGDAPFGDDAVSDLEGEAEEAWGHRLLLSPVLRVKLGPVLLRNVTDLAWFRFDGRGPYFLEWEYDTLLKDGDWLVFDSVQALAKLWQGSGENGIYGGPFFEIAHAGASGITQERAGLIASWTGLGRLGLLRRPRTFLQAGLHLRDPNREGEFFLLAGVGFSFDVDSSSVSGVPASP
jgi:hypothetical protein